MALNQQEKEHRVKQLAKMFASAIVSVEKGQYTNAVLVPFSQGDTVEVHITNSQGDTLIRRLTVDEDLDATI